jgi:hypothetical protein
LGGVGGVGDNGGKGGAIEGAEKRTRRIPAGNEKGVHMIVHKQVDKKVEETACRESISPTSVSTKA